MTATEAPTMAATGAPTIAVTEAPAMAVTEAPAMAATKAPAMAVTGAPTGLSTSAPSPMPSLTTDSTDAPTVGEGAPKPSSGSLLPPSTSTVPTAFEKTAVPTGSSTTEPSPMPSSLTTMMTKSPTASENEGTAMPSASAETAMPTDVLTDSPSLAPTIFDDESPSKPGTPILIKGQKAATTVSFKWTGSMDNVAVTRYDIYDGPTLVGNATTNSFTATDLAPNEEHSFTVVALDASKNESPASNPLVVHTLILVDDFDDEDNVAEDNWGLWLASCDGTLSNGGSSLQYLEGVGSSYGDSSFGARLDYEIDGGEWGFCNLFLDFDETRYKEGTSAVDLTMSNVTGVQFQLQGSEGSTVSLQLGTPLAEYNWIYYRYDLTPSPDDWETVTVNFGEFVAEEGVPYTISDALKSATTLVWEVSQVGRVGWFMLDNVDFTTTASNPEDVISSGAVGLSLVVSIALSLVLGTVLSCL